MIKKIYGQKLKTRQITMIGLLFAVTIVLGVTGIGFLPIPPFKTTIMHIPVIIGAIVGGPIVGAITGLLFGIFSIIQAINTPLPTSFIFMNPLVSVLPRILIGIISYYVYKIIKRKSEKSGIILGIIAGSFTNTLGVLGMIYILYINAYANALHISYSTAVKSLLILVANGIISAAMALIVSFPIIIIVKRIRK
ncbi:ECF transporter S component [Clostridium felsineum]|uniref:Uncharacterized protein n=1 Tax=Clostridium felsineum TaxID=36839 RepID=A0A1S8MGL1_9CLOT|nr:ECF transporter S component [Clostridium felsineum]URZ03913.1 hypothetical protein CLAUR_039790 [Clostridium felsineum]URZ07814.1 hypothetical protein CLROS_031750 [Clostridium felsineum]URZ12845.1 hypothetical protein CROST_035900 [Clostridium felsineum]URZ15186.1 hypothetical protein CLFE_012040 [Clostridium felsineum DSM 794]